MRCHRRPAANALLFLGGRARCHTADWDCSVSPASASASRLLPEKQGVVRYSGTRHVRLPNGREFDAERSETVTISLNTDVLALG